MLTSFDASGSDKSLLSELFQNHVIGGEVGRFSECALSEVQVVRVCQTLNKAELWCPSQLDLRLLYGSEEMLQHNHHPQDIPSHLMDEFLDDLTNWMKT